MIPNKKSNGTLTPIYILRVKYLDTTFKYYRNGWGGDFGFSMPKDAPDYKQKRHQAFEYTYTIHHIATELGYKPTLMLSVAEKPDDNAVTDIELIRKFHAVRTKD